MVGWMKNKLLLCSFIFVHHHRCLWMKRATAENKIEDDSSDVAATFGTDVGLLNRENSFSLGLGHVSSRRSDNKRLCHLASHL